MKQSVSERLDQILDALYVEAQLFHPGEEDGVDVAKKAILELMREIIGDKVSGWGDSIQGALIGQGINLYREEILKRLEEK